MPDRNSRRKSAFALALLVASSGCRLDSTRRAGVDPSTVGRDRASVPRGSTIPPAGLGVDLVRRADPTADPSATPAGLSRPR